MNTPYIDIKKLCYKAEDNKIIKGLDLSIEKSDFTALTGKNGCGKTTLTKLMLGILKADSGSVLIDGKEIRRYKLHEIGSKIGYVFQNPNYQIFAPTIEEELSFAMKYKGVDQDTIAEKTEEMINRFSLNEARQVTTYNLSRGEKQRLAIACMLLNEPEFIILDEPTVGLDSKRKIELMEILKDINKTGIGVLIVSHDKEIVKQYAKRIVNMKDGIIYEDT